MFERTRSTIETVLRSIERRPAYGAVGVFALALAFRIAYLVRILTGSRLRTPRDTQGYLEACDVLFTDPGAIAAQTKGVVYLGFTVPFCSVLRLTGGSETAWAVVQVLLSAITVVLVYYTGIRLVNLTAGIVAGVSLALLFDTLRYTVYLLSETTFVFVLVLAIWSLSRYHDDTSPRNLGIVVASLALLVITRPFGFPLVTGWLLYELFPSDSDFRIGLLPRKLAIAGALIGPLFVQIASNATNKLSVIEQSWQRGWILYGGGDGFPVGIYEYTPRAADSLLKFVLVNVDHVIIMGLLRGVVFFVPLLGRDSLFWTVFNAAVLVPLLLGTFVGSVRAVRSHKFAFTLLVTPVLVILGITMLTVVSLSWRYRAPLGPVFALLTGYVIATDERFQRAGTQLREWITSG